MQTDEMRQAMSTLNAFSEKERAYHAYQARQNYLREQSCIKRALEKLETLEAAQEALQAENETLQAEKETLQAEKETLQAEKETLQEEKEAALAELARLRARLRDS